MTVQCMCCKMILGEKCSRCGKPALVYVEIFPQGAASSTSERRAICKSLECGRTFLVGEGGITSGICPECAKRALAAYEAGRSPGAKNNA